MIKIVPHDGVGRRKAMLDISKMDSIETKEKSTIQKMLIFTVATYSNIANRGDVEKGKYAWETTFGAVNRFLATLSDEDHRVIVGAFLEARQDICKSIGNADNMAIAESNAHRIGVAISNKLMTIDLYNKMAVFTKEHMIVGDYSKAGSQVQDSEEMTFRPNEDHFVTAVVMLGKLFAPIMGETMNMVSSNIHLNTEAKNLIAYDIVSKYMHSSAPAIIAKLDYYVGSIAKQALRKKGREANDIINNTNRPHVYARGFINVRFISEEDMLVESPPNILSRIYSVTKTNAEYHQTSTVSINTRALTKSVDESNSSRLDVDSATTKTPFYVTCVTQAYIDVWVNDILLTDPDLDREMYDKLLEYYTRHPIEIWELNLALTIGICGGDIGGGEAIELLDYVDLIKLVSIIQMMAVNDGAHDIALLLTAAEHKQPKENLAPEEQLAINNCATGYDYRNCAEHYEQGDPNLWADGLRDLVQQSVTRNWVVNSPKIVYDRMGIEPCNGRLVTVSGDYSERLNAFIARRVFDALDDV